MTRRDFELIAQAIQTFRPTSPSTRKALASHFASFLATSNPRFDRERFEKACGVES